jgi:hypothetical protein
MNRVAKLQCLGPFALFAAALAAEAAAYALAQHPTSAFLWYVNLRLFGIFQRSYYVLSSFTDIPAPELIFIATPVMLAACYGLLRNRRLPLAIASNISVVYAVFLMYSWNSGRTPSLQASLTTIAVPPGPGFALLAVLIISSLASMLVSHLLYFRAVRTES